MSALATLAAALRAEGGLVAAAMDQKVPDPFWPGADVTTEAVREGYLLHYDEGRIVAPEGDPDLALLAGDRLYALGLDRLAQAGDLDAVAALAELIAECAVARSAGERERAESAWARFAASRT
jgi:hypothetical protein